MGPTVSRCGNCEEWGTGSGKEALHEGKPRRRGFTRAPALSAHRWAVCSPKSLPTHGQQPTKTVLPQLFGPQFANRPLNTALPQSNPVSCGGPLNAFRKTAQEHRKKKTGLFSQLLERRAAATFNRGMQRTRKGNLVIRKSQSIPARSSVLPSRVLCIPFQVGFHFLPSF